MSTHLLYQLDLEGADSWTVAAECAALGDPMMLDDLKARLRVAKAVCLIHQGLMDPREQDRGVIKALLKSHEPAFPDWLYPSSKSVLYGYCYGSGWMTTRDTILKYSMADLPLELGNARPIALSKAEIEKLRECCALRYPGIALWHAKEGRDMREKGYLAMPTGHVRRFWGLKCEWKQGREQANHETLREWLASKPQYNTTYALKLALHRLWHDGENRRDGVVCPSCHGRKTEQEPGEEPGTVQTWPCQECKGRGVVKPPVVPCSERSFEPVREVVGMVTGGKSTAELVKEARWRRKR